MIAIDSSVAIRKPSPVSKNVSKEVATETPTKSGNHPLSVMYPVWASDVTRRRLVSSNIAIRSVF